jgi:hypothetical protein
MRFDPSALALIASVATLFDFFEGAVLDFWGKAAPSSGP